MTTREAFFAITTYEEFDRRREEFKELTMADKEVREHLSKIFGTIPLYDGELYMNHPDTGLHPWENVPIDYYY